jgi:hypothetical protein
MHTSADEQESSVKTGLRLGGGPTGREMEPTVSWTVISVWDKCQQGVLQWRCWNLVATWELYSSARDCSSVIDVRMSYPAAGRTNCNLSTSPICFGEWDAGVCHKTDFLVLLLVQLCHGSDNVAGKHFMMEASWMVYMQLGKVICKWILDRWWKYIYRLSILWKHKNANIVKRN